MKNLSWLCLLFLAVFFSCNNKPVFDTIIRNGMIYDGNGGEPYPADIAINADTIAFIGDLKNAKAKSETDAKGMAITPGFINMLAQGTESLIQDGRAQNEIRQGVTLEVFGEGWSMGPINAKMKAEMQSDQPLIKYKISWNTLKEYLDFLAQKGVSCNVASLLAQPRYVCTL